MIGKAGCETKGDRRACTEGDTRRRITSPVSADSSPAPDCATPRERDTGSRRAVDNMVGARRATHGQLKPSKRAGAGLTMGLVKNSPLERDAINVSMQMKHICVNPPHFFRIG